MKPLFLLSPKITLAQKKTDLDKMSVLRGQTRAATLTRLARGFTLLEVMLVTALTAVIAVTAVAFFENQVRDVKVDKTALQIQQYLQAAMAYYANHSGNEKPWPSSLEQLVQSGYLPQNPDAPSGSPVGNPWGLPYTGGVLPNTQYFTLSTTLPADLPHADAVADRIAAQLPMATVSNTGEQISVNAQVTPPGQAIIPPGSTYVVWAGELVANGSITNFKNQIPSTVHCPSGLELHTYTALSEFSTAGTVQASPFIFHVTTGVDNNGKMQMQVYGGDRCVNLNNPTGCVDTYDPQANQNLGDSQHPEKFMVLATCEPPSNGNTASVNQFNANSAHTNFASENLSMSNNTMALSSATSTTPNNNAATRY